jgi:ketosteroid isomerase-like protein
MATDVQHDRQTAETIAAVRAMTDAINRHDVDAVMATMTDDIVWETTTPPDGQRFEGAAAVRTAGEGFLNASPNAAFEEEELVALGDRAFQTWTYRWVDAEGKAGHVRGVDIIRVRDGKVAETIAYVKG